MSAKSARCPICGQPAQAATRPFCGPACRDRNLLQWLGEGYRVPGTSASENLQKNDIEGLDSEAD
ncbi:MAG: DNA gyrase inhibitor YacG [Sphingobium sp.]|uniref:DNA gyrase inhibitor YacG n=1 Tax=Sphingobium sp. TaxID=1912891 RepID=UPI000DB4943E|nr:DNA gyrase inhibitor YacG [Sphingobium sp.]PZU15083.1 MAG: DNA gyrase inhibitor YacG [Sphingobium sp.]